jgi:HAD superfamily hydrolase (TIGR01509 family)
MPATPAPAPAPAPLGAVLFDMDGLLVDSEPLWTVAEDELAALHGATFTPEMKAAVVGTRLDVSVPTLLRLFGQPADPEQVARTTQVLLGRMVELFTAQLPPRPGAWELLAEVTAARVPTALVSSSYRVLVDAALAAGLGPFDVVVTGDEVVHGKPHPEPYLTAAARLGVRPEQCVVLEDSPSGVEAGLAAGCGVVAVPSVEGVRFVPGPRTLVAPSLAEVGVDDLRALVAG